MGRIEMILPSLEPAGMETVVVETALGLSARGFHVGLTCIYGEGPLRSRLVEAGITVSLIRLPGLGPNLITRRMEEHLRALAPTVVHSHSGAWLKTSLAANRAGIPAIVHTVHGLLDVERKRELALMWAGALFSDTVIAVSEPLRAYLEDRVKIPRSKLVTVLNGVDAARFTPHGGGAALRERLNLPVDSVLIGNVARFSSVKDHATLLEAFRLVHSERPSCHLVLIGDGELRDQIASQRDRLALQGSVHLLGLLDDPAPAYRDFDLFVLSSVAEGTSMSVLEALASGVPVVATDVGGNAALLGNGKHGVLVPARSPRALATAMETLVDDPSRREKYQREGLEYVATQLTLDRMLDRYVELYEAAPMRPRSWFGRRHRH